MSRYDLVVFGASGYTGQFVAEEIARTVTKSRSWAVAGRNRKKLEAVLVEVGKHVGKTVVNGEVSSDRPFNLYLIILILFCSLLL